MPADAALNALALTAVVRNTRSPQTIGDDQPRPGTSATHATFSVVENVTGSVESSATPAPPGPRNCGQVGGGAACPRDPVASTTIANQASLRMRRIVAPNVRRGMAVRHNAVSPITFRPGLAYQP